MSTVDIGDAVAVQHRVYSGGTLTAATVTLTVTAPDGTVTTPTITTSATGVYNASIPTDQTGVWAYVWSVSGAVPADVTTGTFTVVSVRPPGYCSIATVKLALGITTDTSRDVLIADAIDASSRFIDAVTGRRFYADTSTSARVFRPQGRVHRDSDADKFFVDDIGSASGLTVEIGTMGSASYTAVTDYETGPENALARGRPVEWLLREAWGLGSFARLRVTARWGWPEVPVDVAEATKIQAVRLYRRKDSPEGVAASAEWGAIRLSRIDPDVDALLRPYVLPVFG
jgi:hypothetical protein